MFIICITSILLFPVLLIQCRTKENKRRVAQTPTPRARSRGGSKWRRTRKPRPTTVKEEEKLSIESAKTPSDSDIQKSAPQQKSSLKKSVIKECVEPTQKPVPASPDTQNDESTARPPETRYSTKTARKPPKREEFWEDQNEDDTLLCVKSIE